MVKTVKKIAARFVKNRVVREPQEIVPTAVSWGTPEVIVIKVRIKKLSPFSITLYPLLISTSLNVKIFFLQYYQMHPFFVFI